MKYHELNTKPAKQSHRVGRGISAGQGKTAGRGTKGQKSRTGSGRRPGFEGGQNPLMQRLPKLRGFNSHTVSAEFITTGQINSLKSNVDNFTVFEAGYTSSPYVKVKLISKGELSTKLTVSLQSASKSAVAAVQKAGGKVTIVDRPKRQAKKSDQ